MSVISSSEHRGWAVQTMDRSISSVSHIPYSSLALARIFNTFADDGYMSLPRFLEFCRECPGCVEGGASASDADLPTIPGSDAEPLPQVMVEQAFALGILAMQEESSLVSPPARARREEEASVRKEELKFLPSEEGEDYKALPEDWFVRRLNLEGFQEAIASMAWEMYGTTDEEEEGGESKVEGDEAYEALVAIACARFCAFHVFRIPGDVLQHWRGRVEARAAASAAASPPQGAAGVRTTLTTQTTTHSTTEEERREMEELKVETERLVRLLDQVRREKEEEARRVAEAEAERDRAEKRARALKEAAEARERKLAEDVRRLQEEEARRAAELERRGRELAQVQAAADAKAKDAESKLRAAADKSAKQQAEREQALAELARAREARDAGERALQLSSAQLSTWRSSALVGLAGTLLFLLVLLITTGSLDALLLPRADPSLAPLQQQHSAFLGAPADPSAPPTSFAGKWAACAHDGYALGLAQRRAAPNPPAAGAACQRALATLPSLLRTPARAVLRLLDFPTDPLLQKDADATPKARAATAATATATTAAKARARDNL